MTRRYFVRPDDTFSKIARAHGISIDQLSTANPQVKQINRIFPGQILSVPFRSKQTKKSHTGQHAPAVPQRYHPLTDVTPTDGQLVFGSKVSNEFKSKVIGIAKNLDMNPNHLMAVIAFETGETFSPSVKNAAGSSAVGLIQFMKPTAKSLGTTTKRLSDMTAEDQLDYVEQYLAPYKGRLSSLEDAYMAVLYPIAIGQPNDFPLFLSGTVAYTQNSKLDQNDDGTITKFEAAAGPRRKLERGAWFIG